MTYVHKNTPATRNRMLSVDAVAERLGIASRTVRRTIERGELSIHRIGRRVLIAEGDLDAFLTRHRV